MLWNSARCLFVFSYACCVVAAIQDSDAQGLVAEPGSCLEDQDQVCDEDARQSSMSLLQTSLELSQHRPNASDIRLHVKYSPKPHPKAVKTQRSSGMTLDALRDKLEDDIRGLPLYQEALIFGLFSALSLPIGAMLGAMLAPMSKACIAKWLAFGAGALVFAVATQLYGDSLFALVAISRKYGPFDQGCDMRDGVKGGQDICDQMFWGMIQQIGAGIAGAFMYVFLERCLRHWSLESSSKETVSFTVNVLAPWDEHYDTTRSACRSRFSSGSEADEPVRVKSEHRGRIAMAMWLAMLLDSIPEALMLGFMTNHHQLRFGFLFAIFLANFPEAFSSAGILREQNMSICATVSLWSSIFIVTGMIAMLGSLMMPETAAENMFSMNYDSVTGLAQGISGGAMLALMATVMLPEAYRGAGSMAGVYFVTGFGFSVLVQTLDSYLAGPDYLLHHTTKWLKPDNLPIAS